MADKSSSKATAANTSTEALRERIQKIADLVSQQAPGASGPERLAFIGAIVDAVADVADDVVNGAVNAANAVADAATWAVHAVNIAENEVQNVLDAANDALNEVERIANLATDLVDVIGGLPELGNLRAEGAEGAQGASAAQLISARRRAVVESTRARTLQLRNKAQAVRKDVLGGANKARATQRRG